MTSHVPTPGASDRLEGRVDPELRAAFERKIGMDLTDVATARALFHQARADTAALPIEGVERADALAPGVGGEPPVRVRHYFRPGGRAAKPCLVWIHGGGHVVGTAKLDDQVAARFVLGADCSVVSVDWRRSPEHPFPAEINDCYAALTWVHRSSAELRIDRNRIAIGGASSGAGSAAGLALLARDRAEVPVCFQLLTYPMLDDRNTTPSSHKVTDQRLWNRETNRLAWDAYLRDSTGEVSEYAAPARATDLTRLPPTFIAVGELDLFLDEDITYAQRLLQATVPTELHVYPGAYHSFDLLAPESSVARRFERDRIDALRRGFAAATGF